MNIKPDFSKGHNLAETAPAFLSIWNMESYYGESYIVQNISFNVHEGEILALLGRNGAGKTSTLRSIARMDSPQVTHGEIWLDHQPLHKMKSYEAAAAGIGLVPEDRSIIPGLTVEENLQLAQIAPLIGWSIERLYDLFPRLGERRKQDGVTLSGGEQARLHLARALASDAPVLMADEPIAALDPRHQLEAMQVLRAQADRGASVVCALHDLELAGRYADRVAVLDRGRLIACGSPDAVLDAETLAQVFGVMRQPSGGFALADPGRA